MARWRKVTTTCERTHSLAAFQSATSLQLAMSVELAVAMLYVADAESAICILQYVYGEFRVSRLDGGKNGIQFEAATEILFRANADTR